MRKELYGKIILRFVAIVTMVGGLAADWNRTHLFNPNWPPHAKFHDAMTICLGVFLGGLSLYLLHGKRASSPQSMGLAALLPSLFFGSMVASFCFPNTGGIEAEFPEVIPKLGGFYLNELPFALLFLGLSAVGYFLTRSR